MDEIKLVPMNTAHIPQVLSIERRVFTTPWSKEMFVQEVRGVFGSKAVAAMLGGHVIGYCIAWFIDEEVHLVNLAVTPGYQNRGIGTRLLRQLLDEATADSRQTITLEVRESNAGAQAFYRRFLFQTIGVHKRYYSDNREDALLMALNLEDLPEWGASGEDRSDAG
ncbi:MAG: ribosomal protein S18-alanine N-acetyltransferase [Candidatus Krumholzibacteria bacterium]